MASKDRNHFDKSEIEEQISEMNENIKPKRDFKSRFVKPSAVKGKAEESDEEQKIEDFPELVEIVGVRFHEAGKVYYFAPCGIKCSVGDNVIVKTAKGFEMGTIVVPNKEIKSSGLILPLRSVERLATKDDISRYNHNLELQKEAFKICQQMIKDHGLEMKLIDARYTFDNSQLLFNFTADKRIDFRELVKDLAACFRTRIELRQIGIRDQAKSMGGLGVCGRPFCCSTFLSDFAQVSIKMAKEQNLSLNSSKISGTCGRLMCCLRYEHEVYEEELKKMPHPDSKVKTRDGIGYVTEISPLTHLVKVKFTDKSETITVRAYDRDEVTVLEKKNDRQKEDINEKITDENGDIIPQD